MPGGNVQVTYSESDLFVLTLIAIVLVVASLSYLIDWLGKPARRDLYEDFGDYWSEHHGPKKDAA